MDESREITESTNHEIMEVNPPTGVVMFGHDDNGEIHAGLVHMGHRRFTVQDQEATGRQVDGTILFYNPDHVIVQVDRRDLSAAEINEINQLRLDASVQVAIGQKIDELSRFVSEAKDVLGRIEAARQTKQVAEMESFATEILADIGAIEKKLIAAKPNQREKLLEVVKRLNELGVDTINTPGSPEYLLKMPVKRTLISLENG